MATKNSRSQLMVSEMMCLSSSYIDNNRERNSGSLLSELNSVESRETENKFELSKPRNSQSKVLSLLPQAVDRVTMCESCKQWAQWSRRHEQIILILQNEWIDKEKGIEEAFRALFDEKNSLQRKLETVTTELKEQQSRYKEGNKYYREKTVEKKKGAYGQTTTTNVKSIISINSDFEPEKDQKKRKESGCTIRARTSNIYQSDDFLDPTHHDFKFQHEEDSQPKVLKEGIGFDNSLKQIKVESRGNRYVEKLEFENKNLRAYNEVLLQRLKGSKLKAKY